MSDNHNHILEEVLAGTVPQARPEFQQELEEQLMLIMQERMEMKPMSINDDRDTKPKRIPLGLPVSLAATFAMILFGGLAALIAGGQLPMFSGAAQPQQADSIPQDIAMTATAIIAQATYQAAEAQFLTANAQLEGAARQATVQAAASNPDQAMTSVVQTATAVVQQATERASGDLFLTALPSSHLTATPMIQGSTQEAAIFWTATAMAGGEPTVIPQIPDQAAIELTATALRLLLFDITPTPTPIPNTFSTANAANCPPEKLVVYTAPGTHNPVLTSIDPQTVERYQILGMLTLNEMGEDWFYVTYAYEGGQTYGWVQAEVIRAACESLTSSVIVGDNQITMLPPTVVPPVNAGPNLATLTATPILPTVVPPMFTPTPTAWDAPYMLLTPPFTATPFVIAPEVEQMDDGSYQITLPIVEEPVAEIQPDDRVSVLAEMTYGTDGRAWTVVAQDMQVVALLEPSADAGGFRWMDAVLASSDEETMALLQDMAGAGVAFSLERTP